jgi:hypothetical protein
LIYNPVFYILSFQLNFVILNTEYAVLLVNRDIIKHFDKMGTLLASKLYMYIKSKTRVKLFLWIQPWVISNKVKKALALETSTGQVLFNKLIKLKLHREKQLSNFCGYIC